MIPQNLDRKLLEFSGWCGYILESTWSKSARLQDDTPVHSYLITEVWGEVFNVGLRFWASVDGNDTCAVSQLAMAWYGMVHVQLKS